MKLALAIALSFLVHDACLTYGNYELQQLSPPDENSSLHVSDTESKLFDFPISRALGIDVGKTRASESEKPHPPKKDEDRRIFSFPMLAG